MTVLSCRNFEQRYFDILMTLWLLQGSLLQSMHEDSHTEVERELHQN